ncbi:MAG: efflux RND transporter periplasmic adaptor subunit [Terriglobia bacterium]
MKSYRTAFRLTLAAAIILAAALGYAQWRAHQEASARPADPQKSAAASPAEGHSQEGANTPAPATVPLAAIQLSPQRLQSIGVKTGLVESRTVFNEIRAAGDVEVDEQLQSSVQLRFSGWIQRVFADYTYQYVRKGQPLLTIYSPDLVTTEQDYLIARQNKNLLAASTVPGVASGAMSLLGAAAARLRQWQIPAREISRLETSGRARNDLEIDSPVSGFITQRNVLPQMYVQPETRLYTIASLSTVWIYANVFQDELGQVRTGEPATVTVDSYPARTFYGRVDFIWPQLDVNTRTAKVRLAFANAGLKLMPGMFVNVTMKVPLGRHVTIPASGVFQTGTRNIVFVDHGNGYLEPRNVKLGARAGAEFIVLSGLTAGERIVTSANFLIDSESQLQAALGSFRPPPPGAGAAAAVNAPAEKSTLEFTSSPSPPQKGNDTFRARLTAPGGTPVSGAKVTATFFMAAMPAMGMPAMRTVVTLSDRGGGNYEGAGSLGSAGAWQVSVTAEKNGQAIAARQLTMNATGGR